MELREYRVINRRLWWPHEWPPGPWDHEPDKIQYSDPATGLPCLIIRNGTTFGCLCGYVGVYPGHPWHGLSKWQLAALEDAPDAHGGINYANLCQPWSEEMGICHVPGPGEPEHVWWLGYDCNHITTMDYAPAQDAMYAYLGIPSRHGGQGFGICHPTYKTVGYVWAENARLAQQIMHKAPKALTA